MIRDGDREDDLCRVIGELQKSSLFSKMKADLQKEVGKPHIHVSDMKQSVRTYLRDSGWEVKLQNAVYALLTSLPMSRTSDIPQNHIKEPLAFLRKAQINWEKRIVKSINSMCTELSLPLARKRSAADQAHMSSKFETLGGELDEKQMEKIKPVYAPKDFFEALIGIENPSFTPLRKTPSSIKGWGLIKVQLHTKSLHEMKIAYKELDTGNLHSGVDDVLLESSSTDSFPSDWNKLGRKVIQQGSTLAARQYAKYGCPPGLRGDLWKLILCYDVDDVDLLYFQQLKQYVIDYDMLVDSLITKDIKLTAANDDNYFVFEDVLCQALLVFSRDTSVLKHFEQSSATPPKSFIRGKLGVQDYAVVYPPNGFIPFHGFSLYAAPLGFVCAEAPQLYYLFKQIYTRYFFRLHTMSSHPQGMLSLCVLFENLLQTHEPALFYHLKEVGAHPLRLAFNWLIYAFAGYLDTEQLLLLWDRIFAYNSMDLIAVLAMAVLSYRRSNLLEVTSLQAAQTVLADISTLNTVALLQYVLFLKQ
ncbi:TBC1 domain family member 19-like isoform X1 [Montipora capricornis]|uniref:TBC1 domain family member 19-like isoform X1 n=2 Tax=Montipora capricornis TaxID=246305 RepID=UPI0035F11D64